MELRGDGFARDATNATLLLRAGLDLRLEQRLGPVLLGIGLAAEAPIVGYRALVSGQELFRISPVVLIGNAAVAVSFR
jgi:hypothetical protein